MRLTASPLTLPYCSPRPYWSHLQSLTRGNACPRQDYCSHMRRISLLSYCPSFPTASLHYILSRATPVLSVAGCPSCGWRVFRGQGANTFTIGTCTSDTEVSYELVSFHLTASSVILMHALGPNELSIREPSAVMALVGPSGLPKGPRACCPSSPELGLMLPQMSPVGCSPTRTSR